MEANSRAIDLVAGLRGLSGNEASRGTSPGPDWREANGLADGESHAEDGRENDDEAPPRLRERTYPYTKYLPYEVEDEAERRRNLDDILLRLYMAADAGDFASGVIHWTRELRSWMSLKFDLPRPVRVKLVKFYYELSLAPGVDAVVAERYASTFMVLTKRKHYLRPGKDLVLDWRPLFRELKPFVLPQDSGGAQTSNLKRNVRTLTKLCTFAQMYFDPRETTTVLHELLPFFTTSFTEVGFVVTGLLALLLPSRPGSEPKNSIDPQQYLPTIFHLWSLLNRSREADTHMVGLLCRLARDSLPGRHLSFGAHGIFTADQSALLFTAILRLLDIPVSQATLPYSSAVDSLTGLAVLLDRDPRKHPITHTIAACIVSSLGPAAVDDESSTSTLTHLDGLIQAVETFFHPSNSGGWTKTLAQLVYFMADFFVMRWNREQSGELDVPVERRLNDALKRRFVLALRDVVFMGIYAKSPSAMHFCLSALQNLAYLEPQLMLPGALHRIYPSLQGLVEVHRTTSSLRSLQVLTRTMVRTKGFRCHVTTLLGLALPGVDANDLDKTMHTLGFIQAACYNLPFSDLTHGHDDLSGSSVAVEWITAEVERMEREGAGVELDYANGLSDADEEMVLRSSTAGFGEFLISFLGRVFTLLENLPDASRVRSGSPEENVVNMLAATFAPLFASLSPELYDIALNKIADFVGNHVVHQARDAVAFICSAMCKVNPTKALKRLIRPLIQAIRSEIDENGAASTRTMGSDVLPRDRALVWHLSMLSMCVVHVGDAVLPYEEELCDVARYMQEKCRGMPTVHTSNFIHHLLLNLICTYPTDHALYEPHVLESGLRAEHWGFSPRPADLTIKWHVPSRRELQFAVRLFQDHAGSALQQLRALIGNNPPVKRDGSGREWTDEVSRNLVLLRLIMAGISVLLDVTTMSKDHGEKSPPTANGSAQHDGVVEDRMSVDDDNDADSGSEEHTTDANNSELDDKEIKPVYHYSTGYRLERGEEMYNVVHDMRTHIGELLHDIHEFLTTKQEDDVSCFTALYTAYRTWFIDVGLERSAHTLDRVTRLLASDLHLYKVSGLRKDYPRPLLVRRAHVYHLQRLRHNSLPRPRSDLDNRLLLDLAASSTSLYTEIRKNAQMAGDSAVKVLLGARGLAIPPLLKAFQQAVAAHDYPRIKGAIFSLLFGSLSKTLRRDWKHAPAFIRAFIEASTVDKPSIQKLAAGTTFQVMEWGRPQSRLSIIDPTTIKALAPAEGVDHATQEKINQKRALVQRKRLDMESRMAKFALELVELCNTGHWKLASRAGAMVISLGLRFDTIAPASLISQLAHGTVNPHPALRGLYSGGLVALFSLIEMRALCKHSYENFIRDKQFVPGKIAITTNRDDPAWNDKFLASFAKPETESYIDHDYPGWLVWGETIPAYQATINEDDFDYDEVEKQTQQLIGKELTRDWFKSFFAILKLEPRDSTADRFRMASAILLVYAFGLVLDDQAGATFDDIVEETKVVYGDGTDKHQHRATAEIMGALLTSVVDESEEKKAKVWKFVFPIVRQIYADNLTPENLSYWTTFLHLLLQGRDPRRAWPIYEWLTEFRLDLSSNAAFKEHSKIELLQQCVVDAGWHFQLGEPVLQNFLDNLDHPYKGVREAMGQTMALMYRHQYHESYRDVETLIQIQRETSSIGCRPYIPSEKYSSTVRDVLRRIEEWRQQRTPGQTTPSSYTAGSKTTLLWLDSTLSSYECTQLVPFFPELLEPVLHMMDVKEDPELQTLAFHVFRHMPNIPHRPSEVHDFINALIRIGKTSGLWHQRLRILINIQVIYFRQLFLLTREDQQALFDCVSGMLEDSQLEVRLGAATTLSGMIRCSPVSLRSIVLPDLKKKYTKMVRSSPLPKRSPTGTPTPEHTKIVVTRHAAVLGLGALIQAFPYTSPPPAWLPEVLAFLAVKAAADPGMVGKSVKTILSDFKKTRQDTWHVDVKVFTPEQLGDLEGVLWKSYFA